MAVKVIKRDERREKFDKNKIKRGITNAAKRVDVEKKRTEEIARRITDKVERDVRNTKEVRTSDIRDRVLRELDREERRIADEFRSYRK